MTDEEAAQFEEQENNNETETAENEEPKKPQKDPKDYIVERKEKKAKALEEEVEELRQWKQSQEKEGEKKRVAEVIEKYPFLSEQQEKLEEYAANEAYKNVPLDKLALMVADPEQFIEFGAKKAEEAAKLAGRNVFGGAKPAKVQEKDITNMDDKEFEDLVYSNARRRY